MMPSVNKMVKHMLKISEQMLQDFWRLFDHSVETRLCRVKASLKAGFLYQNFNPKL